MGVRNKLEPRTRRSPWLVAFAALVGLGGCSSGETPLASLDAGLDASEAIAAGAPTPPRPRLPAPPRAAPFKAAAGANAAAPQSWVDSVQERIAAGAYALHADTDGVLAARSSAQGLRARFEAAGVAVRDAEHDDAAPLRFGLRAVGRGDDVVATREAAFAEGKCRADGAVDPMGACLRRAERAAHADVTEWWENRRDGLEHGFTVARAPAGHDALTLEVAIDGVVELDPDGQAASVSLASRKLRYAGLAARDARGRVLPARMRVVLGGLAIDVDDGDAVYPVEVDPLLETAAWNADGKQAFASFGWSVASAGDVNGDGYGDVIVGAPQYDNGQTDEGRAYLYLGSSSGLSATAAWTAESKQANAAFGFSVASAGDVNGDGYGDVIVGAYGYGNGQTSEGRAYVYLGSASGLSTTAAWTAESDQASAYFGYSVASAGDVNGDGYGDVIVGAYQYDNGQPDEGRAYVYLGGASGLSTTAAWTAESDQWSANFGFSVASAGDVNGDGYGDVVVGADGCTFGVGGCVYVYLGSASGLSTTATAMFYGGAVNVHFGLAVASAGDVNGDGYGDVIVGAKYNYSDFVLAGRASVYLGSASGLSPTEAWALESADAGGQYSVASVGDVNGDGYGDVVVGDHTHSTSQAGEGRASVYLGSASGLSTTAARSAESDQAGAWFGYSVASAGDVNGDGYGDVVVGAYYYDNGQTDEGRAYVYLGGASGLSATPGWTAESDQAGAHFGGAVASAGDVNGDGYGDVIVGASEYANGQLLEGRAYVYLGSASGLAATAAWTAESDQAGVAFGFSVASAGDVNGDGYGDVIVGEPAYGNVYTDEGRAYVYLGSASGLSASPAWTVESYRPGAFFGRSVASAGDVNGDGYGDVIVGAFGWSSPEVQEGSASVYLGGASGLSATAAWTAESNQVSALFGSSVASAGDVNGDGYGDVIVGARLYDKGQTDEGRAYLYLGSASGLAATPAWTAESDQAGASFGDSVASAGDVNGDGYGDVVVGASSFDGVGVDAGRAYIYLGSASGLSVTAAWSAVSNQAGASFGFSVASAGDVNADGYADLIAGARAYDNGETDEGRAYLYLGNGGDGTGPGVAIGAQARQPTLATPIAPHGRSTSSTTADVALLRARSAVGRTRAKAQVEAKPLGQPFDGTGFATSATWVRTGIGVAPLTDALTGLAPGMPYHWRARLLYDAATTATWLHSQWVYGGVSGDARGVHLATARPGQGAACQFGVQCTTPSCNDGLCCVSACTGFCTACSRAKTGQPDGICAPVMAGTDPDHECKDDGTPACLQDGYCDGAGACEKHAQPTGCASHACTTGADCTSGFCVDGVCCDSACTGLCQACSAVLKGSGLDGVCAPIGDGLDPQNECASMGTDAACIADGVCNGGGLCRASSKGVACGVDSCLSPTTQTNAPRCDANGACASQGTTACGAYVCAAGVCQTSCATDAQCASGYHCKNGSCTNAALSTNGTPCTLGGECQSGFCVEGVCCDGGCSGGCLSCLASRNVAGTDGTCSAVKKGTDPKDFCATELASSCGQDGNCDGAGACGQYDNTTTCGTPTCVGNESRPRACSAAYTCSPTASGTACGAYKCQTSTGLCLVGCSADADCTTGNWCDGSGACVPKKASPAACAANSECDNGQCVDGFCCDTACAGTCQACSAAKKGQGSDGQCGSIATGADPDNECAASAQSSCGLNGSCDGAGSCAYWPVGTDCAATPGTQTCNGNSVVGQVCLGPSSCGVTTTGVDCAPLKCVAGACAPCTTSNDCFDPTSFYCAAGGSCVAKKAQGAACGGPGECTNGNCVDGFCCDTACAGTCQACSAVKKGHGDDGKCEAIAADADPDNECTQDSVTTCNQTGSCDGAGKCALYASTTVCAAPTCVGNESRPSTCAGPFNCASSASGVACGAFKCKTSTGQCLAACSADSDCTTGNYCDGNGACVPKKATPAACGGNNECSNGQCVDGFCCDTACTETCKACSAAKNGVADGQCLPAPANTDPDGDCTAEPTTSCGKNGACDGTGACATWPTGTDCSAVLGTTVCSANKAVLKVCYGPGDCRPDVQGVDCGVQKCVAGACSACTTTQDCADPAVTYCDAGTCKPKKTAGTCSGDDQCSSGHCVDGVCCNSVCNGACEWCGDSSQPGVCVVVTGPPKGAGRACSQGGTGACAASCDGSKRDGCVYPAAGTECGAAKCVNDSLVTASRCDGAGLCAAGGSQSCGEYACGAVGDAGVDCKKTCTTSADCRTGAVCDTTGPAGVCNAAATTCAGPYSVKGADGTEKSCSGYACTAGNCQNACAVAADCDGASGYSCVAGRCQKGSADAADDTGAPPSGGGDAASNGGCACGTRSPPPGRGAAGALFVVACLALARRRGRGKRTRAAR